MSEEVLHLVFNQDKDLFAIGTSHGYSVQNCNPFNHALRNKLGEGGIGHIQLQQRSNLLALVGGGTNPKYPCNKVILYDDFRQCMQGELLFRTQVKAVRMTKLQISIVSDSHCYIQDLEQLSLKLHDEVYDKAQGEVALAMCYYEGDKSRTISISSQYHMHDNDQSGDHLNGRSNALDLNHSIVKQTEDSHYASERNLVAFPSADTKSITIVDIDKHKDKDSFQKVSNQNDSVASLEFSQNGDLLACASENGHQIRIFSYDYELDKYELCKIFKRGNLDSKIQSLAFSRNNKYLACSSKNNTVHVWQMYTENHVGIGVRMYNQFFNDSKKYGYETSTIKIDLEFAMQKNIIVGFNTLQEDQLYMATQNGYFCVAKLDHEKKDQQVEQFPKNQLVQHNLHDSDSDQVKTGNQQ